MNIIDNAVSKNQAQTDERVLSFDKKSENLWKSIAHAAVQRGEIKKSLTEMVKEVTSHIELPLTHTKSRNFVALTKKCVLKAYTPKVAQQETTIYTLFTICASNRALHLLVTSPSTIKLGICPLQKEDEPYAIDLMEFSEKALDGLFKNISSRKELLKLTENDTKFPQEFPRVRIDPTWLPEDSSKKFFKLIRKMAYETGEKACFSAVPDLSLYPESFRKKLCAYANMNWPILTQTANQILSFQELQLLWLEKLNPYSIFIEDEDQKFEGCALAAPACGTLLHLLDIPWKIVTPYVLSKNENDELYPIYRAEVKPYVNMEFFLSRSYTYDAEALFIETLGEEDVWAAALTLLFQFRDLHAKNIGFRQTSSKTALFENHVFDIPALDKKALSLSEVSVLWRQSFIDEATEISFFNPELMERRVVYDIAYRVECNKPPEVTNTTIGAYPDLQDALKSAWQFVFFDLEDVLYVNNELEAFFKDKKLKHQLPIRNIILSTSWAEKELSDVTVKRLETIAKEEIFGYIDHFDSPFYLRLSNEKKIALRTRLFSIIDNEKKEDTDDLVDALLENEEFWKFIKDELTIVIESEESKQNVAIQILPRILPKARFALSQRIENITNYLTNYQKLKTTSCKSELIEIVAEKSSPLSSEARKSLLVQIEKETVGQVQKVLEKEMKPSLQRLAFSMYPLLQDAVELYNWVHEDDMAFRDFVGEPTTSVEELLYDYLKKVSQINPKFEYNTSLKESINRFQNSLHIEDFDSCIGQMGKELEYKKEAVLALTEALRVKPTSYDRVKSVASPSPSSSGESCPSSESSSSSSESSSQEKKSK